MTQTQNIPRNYDDLIDSRQIIEAVESLADELDDMSEDERHDYDALVALTADASDYAEDWEYGVTLIRDSYFQTYAEELADDIGAVPADVSWPLTCIDWEQAARELQQDYTCVDFDGVTYWVR